MKILRDRLYPSAVFGNLQEFHKFKQELLNRTFWNNGNILCTFCLIWALETCLAWPRNWILKLKSYLNLINLSQNVNSNMQLVATILDIANLEPSLKVSQASLHGA